MCRPCGQCGATGSPSLGSGVIVTMRPIQDDIDYGIYKKHGRNTLNSSGQVGLLDEGALRHFHVKISNPETANYQKP